MPLPAEAFTIRGGCNCGAVRYAVSVPPFDERPPTPYKTPGADVGDLRIPGVYLCHCNNCRRSTSSILPVGLVTETRTVKASVVPRSEDTEGIVAIPDAATARKWSPASAVFNSQSPSLKGSCLSAHKSSPGRSRWFCNRCGTSIAYSIDAGYIPEEWGWPQMLDIWLASVDRDDLEQEYMSPERMLWCYYGIPWIRNLARNGAGGVPEHPLTKIDKVVGDNIDDDLKELRRLKGVE